MKRVKRLKQEGGKWIVWMESTSAALHFVLEEIFESITKPSRAQAKVECNMCI